MTFKVFNCGSKLLYFNRAHVVLLQEKLPPCTVYSLLMKGVPTCILVKCVCTSSRQTLFSEATAFIVSHVLEDASRSRGSESRSRISRMHSSGSALTKPGLDGVAKSCLYSTWQIDKNECIVKGPRQHGCNGCSCTHRFWGE